MGKKEKYEKVVEDDYVWVWVLFYTLILGLNFVAILVLWSYLETSVFCFMLFVIDAFSIVVLLIFAYAIYHEDRKVYWRKM